ncbi:hypothetical protein MMC06_004437 [Schaereria dolodes]|nr:hypothetical protein [Schaereria dolodes]
MSTPGPGAELLGRIAYELSIVQPYIPTYLHLLVSALIPIFAGAHASLIRPSSAAAPPKPNENDTDETDDEDDTKESSPRMEGLSPIDAILYPVLTGCMLTGLYFLIKWLQDPAILNKILNWYLSIFGVFSIARLLVDSLGTISSYIFPARFSDGGTTWEIKRKQRLVVAKDRILGQSSSPTNRSTPLPGPLSRLSLPPKVTKMLWVLRELPSIPLCNVELYMHGLIEVHFPLGLSTFFSLVSAVVAVLYFNLVDKPWWLTNLFGFGFSYNALQLMSPTTFWTGTLVLSSLFVYDIYFVFFTPLMITVATKLDIPVKLLFPRPLESHDDVSKRALAMLGLGDVVLPGIMIGLALRFDLYLFYLRKQTHQPIIKRTSDYQETDKNEIGKDNLTEGIVKAPWRPAVGGWGERFWLTLPKDQWSEGGSFPKTYFRASIVGYVIGMLCTLSIMHIYHRGQPALLYLVPAVLGSLWGTALMKGEIKHMWEYTEATSDTEVEKPLLNDPKESVTDRIKSIGEQTLRGKSTTESAKSKATARQSKSKRCIFSFTLSLPKLVPSGTVGKQDVQHTLLNTPLPSLEDELRLASEGQLGSGRASSSSSSSIEVISRRPSTTDLEGEPAEKRQRRE